MISQSEAKTVYSWATTKKTDINKILKIGDNLKGVGAGKTLAIITPSYLMHKINLPHLSFHPQDEPH